MKPIDGGELPGIPGKGNPQNGAGRARKGKRAPTVTLDEALKTASFVKGPIRRKKQTFEVLTVGAGQTIEVVALSPVEVLETHWIAGRSRPHYNLPTRCEGCECGVDIRLKAFFLGRHVHANRSYLVEVTENALLNCPDATRPEAMIFKRITLKRAGKRVNGRLSMRIGESHASFNGQALGEIDIKPAILAIFLRSGSSAEQAGD